MRVGRSEEGVQCEEAQRLAAVLQPLLEGALAAAESGARRGALAIWPAVLALRELPELISGPWDGLLHRRCSLWPLTGGLAPGAALAQFAPGLPGLPGLLGLPGSADDAAGLGRPRLRVVRRAGWELIRTQSLIALPDGSCVVSNELARRLAPSEHTTEHTAEHTAEHAAHRGGVQRKDPRVVAQMQVGLGDLQAWAHASGDRNAVHLRAGVAAQAGLAVGGQEVIAHGLLLGALSLALVPSDDVAPGVPAWDLKFPAPLSVSAAGREAGLCFIDQNGNCMNAGSYPVLIRA